MAVAVVSLSGASMAYASGGGKSSQEGASLMSIQVGMAAITLVIFVLLIVLLGKFAWRPLITGLKRREDAIRESIRAAAEAEAQVEQTRKNLEEKIAEVQRQAAMQLQQAKADAAKAAELIRQHAEAESRAIKDQALRDIQNAKQQALSDIAQQSVELSLRMASKILARNLTVEDQQRLVEQTVSELVRS
jgi:F-type H+-transporting ATPase subunit b